MIEFNCVIKRSTALIVLLGLITLLAACGGSKKTNEDLEAAFKLHKEALKVRQSTQDMLEELTANMDSLRMENHQTDLDTIRQSLKMWDEQLVEVPGFEEEHDHAGHDHHHHEEEYELNPKQHLEIQQHLLKEIKAIAERIEQIS